MMAIRSSDPGTDGRLELIAVVLVPRVKITVPSLPSGFVARAELCAGLDAGAGAEVALVCAPAGYGKTLLLADWSRTSTGVDTAWVGVDRDDNDPRRLWAAVVAAIAGCPSVPQSSRLHGPWAWRAGAQPEFLGELAEAVQALPQPLRLILDDDDARRNSAVLLGEIPHLGVEGDVRSLTSVLSCVSGFSACRAAAARARSAA
jgi:ATP/maltotriose-dependent transcriptional regulator MalT